MLCPKMNIECPVFEMLSIRLEKCLPKIIAKHAILSLRFIIEQILIKVAKT
jgi:hypothetical protein